MPSNVVTGDFSLLPKAWWCWNYEVYRDGLPVGHLEMSAWRTKGTLQVGGETYRIAREQATPQGARALVMSSPMGERLVVAQRTSLWSCAYRIQIEVSGQKLVLKSASMLSRRCLLLEDDREIGSVAPDGLFTRRAHAQLPPELPLPVQLFILWVAVLRWKRNADAGAVSGAVAAVGN